jgi:hypothetical protein
LLSPESNRMATLFFTTSLFLIEHGFSIFLVSIFIVAFILCYLWVQKSSPPGWKRIAMALGLTFMSIPVIVIVMIIFFYFTTLYYPERNFTTKSWMSNIEKRYQLSDSIIDSGMLIGKTKEEVKELLGEYGVGDEQDTWYYYIGTPPGLFVLDPFTLAINFKDGRVIEVTQSET